MTSRRSVYDETPTEIPSLPPLYRYPEWYKERLIKQQNELEKYAMEAKEFSKNMDQNSKRLSEMEFDEEEVLTPEQKEFFANLVNGKQYIEEVKNLINRIEIKMEEEKMEAIRLKKSCQNIRLDM